MNFLCVLYEYVLYSMMCVCLCCSALIVSLYCFQLSLAKAAVVPRATQETELRQHNAVITSTLKAQ